MDKSKSKSKVNEYLEALVRTWMRNSHNPYQEPYSPELQSEVDAGRIKMISVHLKDGIVYAWIQPTFSGLLAALEDCKKKNSVPESFLDFSQYIELALIDEEKRKNECYY